MVEGEGTGLPVRAIEIAGGLAVAYAGWLLASMGAMVTRVTCPASPPEKDDPHGWAVETLAEGKTGVSLESSDSLERLAGEADILVCDAPEVLESLVGPLPEFRRRFPALHLGVASIYGLEGPYAGCVGTELDAQAMSGMAWALGEPGRSPLSLPPGVLAHQSGAALAAGCLAAVLMRPRGGELVDVALTDVLASYVAGNCRFYVHHGLSWARSGRRASGSGGAYPFVILPCKDGDVCICGRTREEWQRLVKAMGNPAWAGEARYQRLRAMGQEYPCLLYTSPSPRD